MEMENSRRSLNRSRDKKKPRFDEAATFSEPRFDLDYSNRDGAYKPQPIQSELVGQYKSALAELTFNSKPIITNLTIIAGENLHSAKAISTTICSNVIEVPSDQKLPTLYLLDSIVKNIGKDYIRYFAVRLPEVFCKAYRQVESSIHPGMRHLFGTWKGVFPSQCLQIIQKELGFQSAANGSSSGATTSKPNSQLLCQPHNIHVNPKYLEARQRVQQSSRVKGVANETIGTMAIIIADEERVERKSGITSTARKYTELPVKVHNINRPLKEAGSDLSHEKKIAAIYGDHDYNSDISRALGFGIGRGNGRSSEITTRHNGFDTRNKTPDDTAQRFSSTDANSRITQSIASRNSSIVSTSWKHSDEEYVWNDTNRGLKVEFVASNLQRDRWIPDDSENMEFENHVRKSRRINDTGSIFEFDSHIDSLSTEEKTYVGKLSTSANVLTRTRLRPQTTRPHPALKSAKLTGDLGNLQKADFENLQDLTTSVSSLQSKHQNLILEKIQVDHSLPAQKISSTEFSNYKSYATIQNSLPEPSTLIAADLARQSSPSSLLAAIMKSGIFSNNSDTRSLSLQPESQPSSASIVASPPLLGPQPHNKISNSANLSKTECPLSLDTPSIVSGSPKEISSVVSETVNPISDLLSSLVAKGLMSSKNNDSQSLVSPILSIKSQNQNSDVPNSNNVPVSSTFISSATVVSSIEDEISLLEHSTKSVGTLPESTRGEVENLIGFVFKPDVIRESHPSVIRGLFDDLLYQCSICGLRLKLKECLDRHMGWHVLKNSDPGISVKSSRKWYLHSDAWISSRLLSGSKSSERVVLSIERMDSIEPMVPADENQSLCILCGELYEDFYCQARDEWMFKGTVYLPISSGRAEMRISKENDAQGPIVHSKCISETSLGDLGLCNSIKMVNS